MFWFLLKLKKRWLESYDPLQMSLGAAPMMSAAERQLLFDRIKSSTAAGMEDFIRGWFFDVEISSISRYDVLDWTSWSLFEGRNQEHLTQEELTQLKSFVSDIESLITINRSLPPGSKFTFPQPLSSLHGNVFSSLWRNFAHQVRTRRRLLGLTHQNADLASEVLHSAYSESYAALVTRGGAFDKVITMVRETTDRNMESAANMAEGVKRTLGGVVERTGIQIRHRMEQWRSPVNRSR